MPLTGSIYFPVEDVIHGVTVHDPYRWLEDRSRPETEDWIADQQQRCDRYFSERGDLDALRIRVREYLDLEIVDQPSLVAGRYFYRRRNRGQEQACIYVKDVATGQERLLVDPSIQGQFASVGIHHIADDGSLLAFEVGHGGKDEKAIQFVEVDTGCTLQDRIESGYARGLTFTPDKKGFYYCHERPAVSEDHTILLHRFYGSGPDMVIFRFAHSPGGRLVLTADLVHLGAIWVHHEGPRPAMDLFIAKCGEPTIWRQIFANKPLPYRPMFKHGCIFALSFEGAPRGKLVELNLDGNEIRTVIPEQEITIKQVVFAGDRIFTCHLDSTIPSIWRWTLAGKYLGKLDTPSHGTIRLFSNHDEKEGVLFYTYESFFEPPSIFEYVPNSTKARLWHHRDSVSSPSLHPARHVSFSSKDGTQIPMTLLGLSIEERRSNTPVIMTSYGGFGVPMTPQFSVLVTMMVELGAVFALPQIRGGGEFGREWHDAGKRQQRQTAFDDFIAAGEWLCGIGITQPERLAIFGGSNSGLLVAAAMTQRPELFRSVLCMAPLLDMVRYERFDHAAKWRMEYGTVCNSEDFHALHAYSPYHHITSDCNYPSVLFVTGDRDDRCNPVHVRKMAARLQEREIQTNPVVVDYSLERGHSPAMPLSVRTEALVRRIGFLCRELKIPHTAERSL
jgi:prolyl oligopeptidase